MAKQSSKPDISHVGEPIGSPSEQAFQRHKREYSDMCPYCQPRIERHKRISALFKSLKGFGYATLTWEEVEAAYEAVFAGTADGADIIHRLVRSQLVEAGLIKAE